MQQEIQTDEVLKALGELYLQVRMAEQKILQLQTELDRAKAPAPPKDSENKEQLK